MGSCWRPAPGRRLPGVGDFRGVHTLRTLEDAVNLRAALSTAHRLVVIRWGTLTGLTAAVLLLAGGLNALQQVTIIAAFPFMLVMIGMCWSLVVELRKEPRTPKEPDIQAVVERATLATVHAARR